MEVEAIYFGNDVTDAAGLDLPGWMVRDGDDPRGPNGPGAEIHVLFISLSRDECLAFAARAEERAARQAELDALPEGTLRQITWRTVNLGHGNDAEQEEGQSVGYWGASDAWGKRAFHRAWDGEPLYLFPDEVLSDEPFDG